MECEKLCTFGCAEPTVKERPSTNKLTLMEFLLSFLLVSGFPLSQFRMRNLPRIDLSLSLRPLGTSALWVLSLYLFTYALGPPKRSESSRLGNLYRCGGFSLGVGSSATSL